MSVQHGQTPDPIPNADERRVLRAARLGQLIVTSGGKPAVQGGHCYTPAPITAYRRCEAQGWIKPADHRRVLTDAGAAALDRIPSPCPPGSRQ